MKRAIISDVHSNLEAFKAVLKDLEEQGVEEIYCLGDLIGYGPNPVECVDLMMNDPRRKVCLLGNHDSASIFDPKGFNLAAENAIYWTRDQLDKANNNPRRVDRWDFLGMIPKIYKDPPFLYVHGSARNPLSEYVFSDDIMERGKMEKIFALIPKYCFQGHTHVPGIFTEDNRYLRIQDLDNNTYKLGDQKLMINVGSVGQPRDKDPRACYVVHDLEKSIIEYRRVPYDVDVTSEKIFAIAELDNFLGERIKQGR